MNKIIDELLKEKNLTDYRLSKLTGVSTSALSSLRTGKVKSLSFENLEKIADALDISLDIFRTNKK
jgi:DNA-binding Xre family transcriptional regulator